MYAKSATRVHLISPKNFTYVPCKMLNSRSLLCFISNQEYELLENWYQQSFLVSVNTVSSVSQRCSFKVYFLKPGQSFKKKTEGVRFLVKLQVESPELYKYLTPTQIFFLGFSSSSGMSLIIYENVRSKFFQENPCKIASKPYLVKLTFLFVLIKT